MTGQTRYRRARRPDLDRAAVRHFIYRLHDAEGGVLYVGRSCNVAGRIRAHFGEASHPYSPYAERKALWLADVRTVSMVGPYSWDEAVQVERAEIERHQPHGNVALTTRDHRPQVAASSARRAS